MCTRSRCRTATTFFCRRTTLVHFFSSRPSYFLRVASSKLSATLASSRKAAAVFGALITPRYAIMALCLPSPLVGCDVRRAPQHSQLLRLPVCQDSAHGGDGRTTTMHGSWAGCALVGRRRGCLWRLAGMCGECVEQRRAQSAGCLAVRTRGETGGGRRGEQAQVWDCGRGCPSWAS